VGSSAIMRPGRSQARGHCHTLLHRRKAPAENGSPVPQDRQGREIRATRCSISFFVAPDDAHSKSYVFIHGLVIDQTEIL
jgi:hypothetical protein